jgi:hypothetical protein
MPKGRRKRTTLSNDQEKALNLYIRGWAPRRIADALDITPEVICIWRREPGPFRDKLQELMRDVELSNSISITSLVTMALEELPGLLQDVNPQVRLAASKLVLDQHNTMVAQREQRELLTNLEDRLEALQGQAQQQLPQAVDVSVVRESERSDAEPNAESVAATVIDADVSPAD